MGNLRPRNICFVVLLVLSAGPISAQVGACHAELPQEAAGEIDLWRECDWLAASYLPPTETPTTETPPAELALLVDAPSYIRESIEAGSQSPAVPASQYAEADLTPAQHVLAAVVPPAKADYRPLTPLEKLDIFLRSTYSPDTFLSAAFDAGLAQASGDFRGYGGGMGGYGKRYAAALANSEASIFFSKFFYPWIFKQDPRYFRMKEGPVSRRAVYAVSRVFITRSDDGGSTFNSSRLLGRLTVKALSNSYYPPERRGVWPTLRRSANCLISDAGMALAKEFWPDVRDKLFGRRLPDKVENVVNFVVTGEK